MTDKTMPKAWTHDQILEAERAGERLKFVLFWGHTAPKGGGVGPHLFSQWWPQEFEVDGVSYRSAEHYMMAEKARLFDDDSSLRKILAAKSPAEAKAEGRRVQGFTDELWVKHRDDVVFRASVGKFGSDAVLRDYLVGTGDRVLVEASPRDRIWGIGMGRNNPSAEKPSEWQGLNLLGFALMRARAALAA